MMDGDVTRPPAARLWSVPVYLPYLQPPLTDAAIEAAEAYLGIRLPVAYIEALKVQNGGYIDRTLHPSGHAAVDWIAGIGPRFPSLLRKDWSAVVEYMAEEGLTTPARIDDLVPFCGDGHYYYCLDYRESGPRGEPRVTYIDVESFDVDEVVARDFGTFLRELAPDEPTEALGLVTSDEAETVASAISRATGLVFKDRGDQDHGYRTFAARLPSDEGRVFLTANRTRRGFVRDTDPEYDELRRLLPEIVDRYPEHRDCAYFLTCSTFATSAESAIAQAVAKLGYPVRRVLI